MQREAVHGSICMKGVCWMHCRPALPNRSQDGSKGLKMGTPACFKWRTSHSNAAWSRGHCAPSLEAPAPTEQA